MEREAADVELPQTATPEQTAWLHATRIPLRTITFSEDVTLRGNTPAQELSAAATFTTSLDMLAASMRTLQVAAASFCHDSVVFTMRC